MIQNISYLCSLNSSSFWDANGWKNIVFCIIADGRSKVSPQVLDVLTLLGVYQHGVMIEKLNERPVSAHLFEFTTQVTLNSKLEIQGMAQGAVPIQVLFCLKEKNAQKVNKYLREMNTLTKWSRSIHIDGLLMLLVQF